MRRHEAAVYRFALAIARSQADAEDAMQEAFVAAYQHASTYRAEASVRTWLLTMARNAVWRQRRRLACDVVDEALDDVDEWRIAEAAGWGQISPEQAAISAAERERLHAALNALPTAEREVLVLRELEELSGEDTARVLGLSLAAMKSRLHRARLRLAAALRAEGPITT